MCFENVIKTADFSEQTIDREIHIPFNELNINEVSVIQPVQRFS